MKKQPLKPGAYNCTIKKVKLKKNGIVMTMKVSGGESDGDKIKLNLRTKR